MAEMLQVPTVQMCGDRVRIRAEVKVRVRVRVRVRREGLKPGHL